MPPDGLCRSRFWALVAEAVDVAALGLEGAVSLRSTSPHRLRLYTGDGAAAVEQLEIVTAERVSPAKFVWVHAQNERDHGLHEKVARAGAWVELDGIGPKTAEFHLQCVGFLAAQGLLRRTLA